MDIRFTVINNLSYLVEWILCIELPAKTSVGPGLVIHHGQGLVVNNNT